MYPFQSVEEKREQTSDATNTSYESQIESFKSLAGDADVERLEEFLNQLSSSCGESVSPIVLSPDSDKSHRTVGLSCLITFFHLMAFSVSFDSLIDFLFAPKKN